MRRLLLAAPLLLLATNAIASGSAVTPPGFCLSGDCPLTMLHLTAPPDIHAESSWPAGVRYPVTTCKGYIAEAVDDSGLTFRLQVFADTTGGVKHPSEPGTLDSVCVVSPPPRRTWSVRIAGVDSAGNIAEWSNAVAICQVGTLVSLDSCCTISPPMRRTPPVWNPDRAPGEMVLRRGFASYTLGRADSNGVLIETQRQTQERYRSRIVQLFGYYCVGGLRVYP